MRDSKMPTDLRLEKFNRANANLILRWRNTENVRNNFLNNEVIQLNDHLQFVNLLENQRDLNYFIVHLSGQPVAVLNVNFIASVGSWGCYLIDEGKQIIRPGVFPMLIGLSGIIAFDMLSCEKLCSDVLQTNTPPQAVNSFLKIPQSGSRVEYRSAEHEVAVLSYTLLKASWPLVALRINELLTRHQRKLLSDFAENPKTFIHD